MRRRSSLLIAVLLSVLLAGCSPADQSGITLNSETGRPAILVALCEDQSITAVRLTAARFEDGVPVVDGDDTLWRIEAADDGQPRDSVVTTEVVVGVVPPGFEEVVPLDDSRLPSAMALFAEVEGSVGGDHGGVFPLDELSPDALWGVNRTSEELARQGRASCHPGILQRMGLIYDDPSWLRPALVLGGLLVAALAVGTVFGVLRLRRKR